MDSVEVGQFSAILLFIYRFLLFWVALHKASPKIFYFFVSLLSFRLIYYYERILREGLYLKWLQLCLALIEDVAEQQKFEQMYWQYRKLMFHCAKKRLQDDQLAEDAVSTAFLSVAQNMGMVKEAICSETKWLLVTIVERAAINLYKKQQRIYNHTVPLEEVEDMTREADPDLVYSVAEAIEKLPELQRQIILLRYADGYTNRDIAAMLDFTVAKVDKIISRARKQLAFLLREVSQS